MSEKQNRNLPHEEEFAEIELSGEQLLRLTKAASSPRASERRRWKSAAAITGVGSVLALAAIIGYENLRSAPQTPAPPPPPPIAQIEPPQVTEPVGDQTPVLVRNPFDRSEVFEFPPGTTPEEAHAAVADALLERARERQAEYDARHPRRRRSG